MMDRYFVQRVDDERFQAKCGYRRRRFPACTPLTFHGLGATLAFVIPKPRGKPWGPRPPPAARALKGHDSSAPVLAVSARTPRGFAPSGRAGRVSVHGSVAQAVFSAACERDSPIFAAGPVDPLGIFPGVPRKLGPSPVNGYAGRLCEKNPFSYPYPCRASRPVAPLPVKPGPATMRVLVGLALAGGSTIGKAVF